MKTIQLRKGIIILLTLVPSFLMAAWNPVRFDQFNYFTSNFTPAPQTSFVSGINSTGTGSFLMRTNDGGLTWDSINFTGNLSTSIVNKMYFTDINHGFAGGSKNSFQLLMTTTDNGTTWTDITPDPTSQVITNSISFIDPLQGYVSGSTELYKTFDGGNSWINLPVTFEIASIHFTDMNTGFACGTENNAGVVNKTTDGGLTWNNMLSVSNPFMFVSSMQKVEVINSNVVYSSLQYSNNIYRTSDGGNTWDTITIAQIFSIQDYDFIDENEGQVLSTMGEIYRTIDGGLTWTLEYTVAGGVYGPSVFLTSISFAGTTGYVCGSNGLIKKYTIETTGLSNNLTDTIKMYPNPVQKGNQISISGMPESCVVEICNVRGQVILKQQFGSTNEDVVLTISNNFSEGLYTVTMISNTSTTKKLLVVTQ